MTLHYIHYRYTNARYKSRPFNTNFETTSNGIIYPQAHAAGRCRPALHGQCEWPERWGRHPAADEHGGIGHGSGRLHMPGARLLARAIYSCLFVLTVQD